jgi:hypothetical protein
MFLLLSWLELSKGIVCPHPRACNPVSILVDAIGIAPSRLSSLDSCSRSPGSCQILFRSVIGYLKPLLPRLAPPLHEALKPLGNSQVQYTNDRIVICYYLKVILLIIRKAYIRIGKFRIQKHFLLVRGDTKAAT